MTGGEGEILVGLIDSVWELGLSSCRYVTIVTTFGVGRFSLAEKTMNPCCCG